MDYASFFAAQSISCVSFQGFTSKAFGFLQHNYCFSKVRAFTTRSNFFTSSLQFLIVLGFLQGKWLKRQELPNQS